LTFLHYSDEQSITPVDAKQSPTPEPKPRGLWLSVVVDGECDWTRWCESEWPTWMRGKQKHEVRLAPDANVLRLSSPADLDRFTREYCIDRFPLDQPAPYARRLESLWVRWDAVAALYDGIIIAPYCWQRRLTLLWYYGWDAASGCIWNARAIERIERML